MEIIPSRIINIGTDNDATFALKFMTGPVAFTFNREYVAIATDPITVFVYPLHHKKVSEILQNENIVKILIKPVSGYNEKITNYIYLADYITDVLNKKGHESWMIINRMNLEILEEGNKLEIDRKTKDIKFTDTLDRIAGGVGLIMMKYKIMVDGIKEQESTLNQNRDCLSLYLKTFNSVLSRYGPMKFADLINKVKERGSLCMNKMNPILALQGLIESGALYHNIETTIVGIPDQQN